MKIRPRPITIQAACLLGLLLILAFYDVVFLGKTFKVTTANSQALHYGVYGQQDNKPPFIPVNGTDAPVLEEPIYEFIKNSFKKGIVPLWNPHQACGYPLMAMIQVGIFYPLNFIMYLFPQIYGWDILILVRLLLAGLFAYWFMRSMRFNNVCSLTTGIVFMLSGPMVLLQYWTANVDIITPLLFIATDRIIKEGKPRHIAFLGLSVALTILAGHPEHIFLVNAFGVAYFCHRLIVLRSSANWKKAICSYFCSYLIGAGLSAIVLFPFLHNLLTEFWHGHPGAVGLLMEEQRERAITLALPHFFQTVPLTYQWQFSGWWGGYLGTLPLGLASLSLFYKQRKGLNYFFAAIALILIGKQYGVPIINWLGYLPLFNMCRYAIHSPAITALSVAILAGMGMRTILAGKKIFKKSLIFSLGLLFIIGIHLLVLNKSEYFPIALKASLFALGLLVLFHSIVLLKERRRINHKITSTLLVFIIFAELFLYIHRERPKRFDSFAQVPYIEFLKSSEQRIRSYGMFWAFYPNTATGFGVDDLGYFFGLVPKRFVHFVNNLLLDGHFKKDLRPPALRAVPITQNGHILDLLNVKYIIAPSRERLQTLLNNFEQIEKQFKTAYSKEATVFQRPFPMKRTFIVHRALFQTDKEKTFTILRELGPKVRGIVILNDSTNQAMAQTLKGTPVIDQSTSRIVEYTPNKVVVEANLEHPGLLVLSDAYHPDWRAYANGQETKIFQTNYLLRSVFLQQGKHRVEFVFKPLSFYLGAWISLLSLVILGLLLFAQRLKIKNG